MAIPPALAIRRPASSWLASGGCDFPVDPALPATAGPVFWRLDEDLAAVVLGPAPAAQTDQALTAAQVAGAVSRPSDEGRWLARGAGRFKAHLLLAKGAGAHRPLAAITPLDEHLPVRLAMAARAWRILRGAPAPADDQLTAQRRRRLRLTLRALDGRQQGASHRELANGLFGAGRVAEQPWKTSPLRDTTLRLVRDGAGLAAGGYRRLLRPERVAR